MVKLFASKSKLFSIMADLNGKFIYSGKFTNLLAKEVFAVKQNGLWVMYIQDDEFTRLGNEGKKAFSQKSKVEEYLEECQKAIECYSDFCERIHGMTENYDGYRSIVKNYYKIYSLLMAQYRITNLETTYQLTNDVACADILAKNRWDIRKTFMDGNRIFYDYVRFATQINAFDEVIPYMTMKNLLEYRNKNGIEKAKNITGIKCDEKGIEFISDDEIEDGYVKKYLLQNQYVKGVNVSKIACVRGKALVLKDGNIDEYSKSLLRRDKYIVIALTLHFDIAEFCDNVLGLACDEGGVLSHSAIIAREYRIPCITGTLQGTVHFQTGDLVELDTEKEILKHCSSSLYKDTKEKMNTNINIFLQRFFEKSEIEAIYRKIDTEVNREMRENCVDYEFLLEKIFIKELENVI